MARTRIGRVLPTDEFLALINAANPSALNPFATIADLVGLIPISYALNYSALPAPNTVAGSFYYVEHPQGTKWLPESLGGTYYPNGLYYSNGVSWVVTEHPYQATQSEVNSGTNTDKFVTPSTFENATKWSTKADVTHTHTLSQITNVTISSVNLNSLDDGIDSTLHFHVSDRARANHTGTQLSATISDFSSTVLGTLLSGLSLATAQVVASTDTILLAIGYLQAQVSLRVVANTPITGATKTKITFDAKGLITSGADATTADINDSFNRRYVTDTDLTDIGNLSGVNSGDQNSIVGITGIKSQFNTAVTDGDFLYVGDIPIIQRGVIAPASFTGNPDKHTLVFPVAFTDANYSISIIGVNARTWSVDAGQTAAQVVINSNANPALTGNVYWTAIKH